MLTMAKHAKKTKLAKVDTNNKFLNLDFSELSSLFTIIFASYSAFMFIFWLGFMKMNPSENADRLLFLGSGLFALSVALLAAKLPSIRSNSSWLYLSLLPLSIGVIVKEHQEMSRQYVMGFGLSVFLIALVITPLIPILIKNAGNRKILFGLLLISIFLITLALLSFWQTKNSLIESLHSEYVVNELLAPRTGYSQYSDFVPQYTFVLGYLFKLIPSSFSYLSVIQFTVMTLTAMAFLSLISAIFIASRLLKNLKGKWLYAILIVVPLTSVTAGWGRTTYIGPPTTLLSGPAIRIFSGMILGILLFFFMKQSIENRNKFYWYFLFGSLAAVASLINLDFGFAATLAILITLIALVPGFKSVVKVIVYFGVGYVAAWLAVLTTLNVTGNLPMSDRFAWFIRQFGSGFGSVPISYPGPVMFALPTIFSLMIFSGILTIRNVRKNAEPYSLFISTITFYFATWTFFSTPYYLNRSYHSGQMSTLYLPLSVAIVGLFAMLVNEKRYTLKNRNYILPTLLVAVSVATIWISPNPSIELKRINGDNQDGNLPRAGIQKLIDNSDEIKKELEKLGTYGYFGEEGNIVQLATGIKSANIFNDPSDMFTSAASTELGCKIVLERNFDYLLVTSKGAAAFKWPNITLCDGAYDYGLRIGDFEVAKRVR